MGDGVQMFTLQKWDQSLAPAGGKEKLFTGYRNTGSAALYKIEFEANSICRRHLSDGQRGIFAYFAQCYFLNKIFEQSQAENSIYD